MMVVGDDDQSIYGWRGARIENIRQFTEDFPKSATVKLEQNYRSTGRILNAANAVIANNPDRLGKELHTDSGDGEAIQLYSGFNEMDEARFISDRISEAVSEGRSRSDIAILYRSNAQSRNLEEALLRAGIPYRIYGGQRFFERAEIKNALAYLRLISTPHDDTSLERVINIPARGIGEKTVEKLREAARTQDVSLWLAIKSVIANKAIGGKAGRSLAEFVDLIETLTAAGDDLDLGELTDRVITHTGLVAHHEKEKGEKGRARVENLEELVSACRQFDIDDLDLDEETETMSPLDAFLANAALESGDTQADQFSRQCSDDDPALGKRSGVSYGVSCRYGRGFVSSQNVAGRRQSGRGTSSLLCGHYPCHGETDTQLC